MFGINPGRFGAGQTGVSFTDPVYLEEVCGIENDLPKKHELSALFIHEMIAAFGGAEKFFSKFFITSVSPLGYLKGDVNANYYDDKELAASVRDFIIKTTEKQMKIGACREYAICIGTGKNFDYLKKLNAERGWFEKLEKVSHPRFVMQYRRKRKEEFVDTYLQVMQESLEATGI